MSHRSPLLPFGAPARGVHAHGMLRRRARALSAILVVSVAAVGLPRSAFADGPPGDAQSAAGFAEALFDGALRLMQEGKFAEACAKLAESHRLDPASGTVYNLAICLEKEGKVASAIIAFEESSARSAKDGNKEREALAVAALARLRPLVAKVVVRVGPKVAGLEGVDVRFDGASVRKQAWGIEVPMDPGAHVLTVSAPGKRELRQDVTVTEPGKVVAVEVSALEDAPVAPRLAVSPTPEAPTDGTRKGIGMVLVGVGGVLLVGGGVSGILAVDRHAESDRLSGDPPRCTGEGADAEKAANAFAWGANLGLGLGVVAAAVGTYLWVTAKTPPRTALSAQGLRVTF